MNTSRCFKKKISLNCRRETHEHTHTHTGWSSSLSLSGGIRCWWLLHHSRFHLGLLHVCWHSCTLYSFFTGQQVHYTRIYDIQCILHVLDTWVLFSVTPKTGFAQLQIVRIFNWPWVSTCIFSVILNALLSTQVCICPNRIQCPHFGGLCCHTLLLFLCNYSGHCMFES